MKTWPVISFAKHWNMLKGNFFVNVPFSQLKMSENHHNSESFIQISS